MLPLTAPNPVKPSWSNHWTSSHTEPLDFPTQEANIPDLLWSSGCPQQVWEPNVLLLLPAPVYPKTRASNSKGMTNVSSITALLHAKQHRATKSRNGDSWQIAVSKASSGGIYGHWWSAIVLWESKRTAPLVSVLVGWFHLNVKRNQWWKYELMRGSMPAYLQ